MQKKFIHAASLLLLMLLFPVHSYATTTVQGLIGVDTKWIASDGPYLITDTIVLPGVSLTIDGGTDVIFDEPQQSSLEIRGNLIVKGEDGSLVSFSGHPDASIVLNRGVAQISGADISGISGIFANRSRITVDKTRLSSGSHISAEYATVTAHKLSFDYTDRRASGLYINRSTLDMHDVYVNGAGTFARFIESDISMSSSTIKASDIAIISNASKVSIERANISTRNTAIRVGLGIAPVFIPNQSKFTGGIGNAIEQAYDFSIHNSSFAGSALAIDNTTSSMVDARMNWWGVGALDGDNNSRVTGPVIFTPSLSENPYAPNCCSNIVFIPGIKGTRLYSGGNQLWEPNRNLDVEKLTRNSGANVEVGEIIDKAYGVVPIYSNFIDQMNVLVSSGTIKYWQPIPYDWRKSPNDLVTEIVPRLVSVASTSVTGKVSIITHSYGGLVAKALIQELERIGKSSLVDKVLFVSMPEYGVPQAFASLLHGYGEAMLGGFLLSQKTARDFAQSISSSHDLLPSDLYFKNNGINLNAGVKNKATTSAVARFYSDLVTVPGSKEKLDVSNIVRQVASTEDLIKLFAKIGDKFKYFFGSPSLELLNGSIKLHDNIDNYALPNYIKSFRVAPWGIATTVSTLYKDAFSHCDRMFVKTCTDKLHTYRAAYNLGDSTVNLNSVRHASGTIYLDLASENRAYNASRSHADILSSTGVGSLISEFVQNNLSQDLEESSVKKISPFASLDIPKIAPVYTVEVFSPVSLKVCDSKNRCTGLVERSKKGQSLVSLGSEMGGGNISQSNVSIPESVELDFVENSIPGSSYFQDEYDGSKGINLLVEQDGRFADYTVILDGLRPKKDELPFATLRISTRSLFDSVEKDVQFVDFPVKENMRFKVRFNQNLIKKQTIFMEVFNDKTADTTGSRPDKTVRPSYIDNRGI